MAQSVQSLSHKDKDLSLSPEPDEGECMVAHTCNPSSGAAEKQDEYLWLTGQPSFTCAPSRRLHEK